MPPNLHDAWAKFRWAKRHVHAVHAEALTILHTDSEPFTFRIDFESEKDLYVLKVDGALTLPDHLTLFVGDALQCLRASLDRLAWSLVQDGNDPTPKKPWRVQFPVFDSPDEFAAAVDDRLPGVCDAKRAAIDSRQPYHRGNEGLHLKALVELSNTDKHRHVPAVLVAPQTLDVTWYPLRCKIINRGTSLQQPVLRPDAVLGYAQIAPPDSSNHQMAVDCKGSAYIAFDLEWWPRWSRPSIPNTLTRIRDVVRGLLEDPVITS